MRPVLLIAANFLREHRWPVRILFVWIILMAFISADFGRGRAVPDDVMFYIIQQAIFICLFSSFVAADAIHNDRKSKRILLVLSKGITRAKYLLAPILGTGAAAIGYSLLLGLCCLWLDDRAGVSSARLWALILLVICVSVLAATITLFFSTFLNPYVAIAATMILFAAPGLFHAQGHHWRVWTPGFPVLLQILNFRVEPGWTLNWQIVIIAILQSVFFWAMALAVFSRKDIAVAVE